MQMLPDGSTTVKPDDNHTVAIFEPPADAIDSVCERTIQHLPLDSIKIGERKRRDLGDVAGLAESIERIGLLHPVVVHPDGRLIVGERRLAAYRHLGRDSIPARVVEHLADVDRCLAAEVEENTFRKPFNIEEAADIGCRVLEVAKRDAKQRQQNGGGDKSESLGESCPQARRGQTSRRSGRPCCGDECPPAQRL